MLNTVASWRAGVGAEWDCLAGRREHYFDSDGVRFSGVDEFLAVKLRVELSDN